MHFSFKNALISLTKQMQFSMKMPAFWHLKWLNFGQCQNVCIFCIKTPAFGLLTIFWCSCMLVFSSLLINYW
jgi:hypothetical protein